MTDEVYCPDQHRSTAYTQHKALSAENEEEEEDEKQRPFTKQDCLSCFLLVYGGHVCSVTGLRWSYVLKEGRFKNRLHLCKQDSAGGITHLLSICRALFFDLCLVICQLSLKCCKLSLIIGCLYLVLKPLLFQIVNVGCKLPCFRLSL